MSFMPWSEQFVLGIESIDRQHRWLVDATNRLHDEVQSPSPCHATIGEILDGLMDYTMNHFIVEEELFTRLGYPHSVAHKAEHDGFTQRAMQLLTGFENGEAVGLDALAFLKDWLAHHILCVDRAYVPFLASRGVT